MMRFIKTTFAAAVIAVAGQSFAATVTTSTANDTSINPAEKAKIEEIVHQYLLQKPEVIVEALQSFQRKQYEEVQQTAKKTQQDASKFADALFHQPNDPTGGNANGKITVVEFFDYQCPHCVDMAPAIEGIIKANPDVRFIFKEFPIRGPMSEVASRAALAANKQGKYYQFSHALLTSKQPLTQDVIYQIAKNTGLDVEKLKTDMNDKSVNDQLDANRKLAQDLKLFGTPAFFIAKSDVANNKGNINYVPGQINQQQMQDEINKASK